MGVAKRRFVTLQHMIDQMLYLSMYLCSPSSRRRTQIAFVKAAHLKFTKANVSFFNKTLKKIKDMFLS